MHDRCPECGMYLERPVKKCPFCGTRLRFYTHRTYAPPSTSIEEDPPFYEEKTEIRQSSGAILALILGLISIYMPCLCIVPVIALRTARKAVKRAKALNTSTIPAYIGLGLAWFGLMEGIVIFVMLALVILFI